MAKKMYVGVGGKARNVKQIYIGVGGVARKVKKAYIGVNGVARLMYQAGTPIGTLPVGSVVKIRESGAWVDYLIVHQGLPSSMYDASCDGTWVLRKDIAENQQWNSSDLANYEDSTINSYLNSTFLAHFDTSIQTTIKQVKIPYGYGGSTTVKEGASGLSCKVFLLGGREVGLGYDWATHFFAEDGRTLSYFAEGNDATAREKRIAVLNGSPSDWWLRSPHSGDAGYVYLIYPAGGYNGGDGGFGSARPPRHVRGIRPAFVLSSTALVADDGSI